MNKKVIENNKKSNGQKKPFYKKWWFLILVVFLVIGSFNEMINGSSYDSDSSSSSSKKTKTNTTSSKSNSSVSSKSSEHVNSTNNKYISTENYNADDGEKNAISFDTDSFSDKSNVGKSIHLTQAKIGRIDKNDGGLWIQVQDGTDGNMALAFVQALYPASNLNEGDIVDIMGIVIGQQKSVVDPTDETYPTIDIKSITKK